jgi:hypothetical protein
MVRFHWTNKNQFRYGWLKLDSFRIIYKNFKELWNRPEQRLEARNFSITPRKANERSRIRPFRLKKVYKHLKAIWLIIQWNIVKYVQRSENWKPNGWKRPTKWH